MLIKEDSKRRINLKFDDLEQDILDWLNSFGKIKRAKIAKAAIRKAMIEGQSASSLLNFVAGQRIKNEGQSLNEDSTSNDLISIDSESLNCLLGLTGSEGDEKILKLI